MIVNTDIDIDVANRDKLLNIIKGTPAMIARDKKQVKHNTGVYFHDIPSNPFSGLSTIDHKEAEGMLDRINQARRPTGRTRRS